MSTFSKMSPLIDNSKLRSAADDIFSASESHREEWNNEYDGAYLKSAKWKSGGNYVPGCPCDSGDVYNIQIAENELELVLSHELGTGGYGTVWQVAVYDVDNGVRRDRRPLDLAMKFEHISMDMHPEYITSGQVNGDAEAAYRLRHVKGGQSPAVALGVCHMSNGHLSTLTPSSTNGSTSLYLTNLDCKRSYFDDYVLILMPLLTTILPMDGHGGIGLFQKDCLCFSDWGIMCWWDRVLILVEVARRQVAYLLKQNVSPRFVFADIKWDNILVNVMDSGRMVLHLADLGSVIPSSNRIYSFPQGARCPVIDDDFLNPYSTQLNATSAESGLAWSIGNLGVYWALPQDFTVPIAITNSIYDGRPLTNPAYVTYCRSYLKKYASQGHPRDQMEQRVADLNAFLTLLESNTRNIYRPIV